MQSISNNIPSGTNMECQEPLPDYSEVVSDILVNGKCEHCGITLDDVLANAETDVVQYALILKLLVTHYSLGAKQQAHEYVRKLAYEMVEEHYR